MAEYFEPGKPNIGYSGKDQDKPKGISIGSSEALRELGAVLAGDQGFENTPDAQDREYTAQVLTAGLSARIGSLESKMATGAEYVDNFNRINSSTLGSPNPGSIPVWVQFGSGQPLELIDQAAQINQGGLLPDDGTRWAFCPQAASSSDYSVLAIVHPLSKTGKIAGKARTTLYGRCNAAGTEGVYVDFWGADGNTLPHCEIGRFTRNGNTLTRTQWRANTERSYNFSSTIELRMVGTRYVVIVDGVELIDHTDVSSFPIDGNHRYSMFSCMTWTGFFGAKPQFSAGLTQLAIRGVDLTAIQAATDKAETAQQTAETATTVVGTVQQNLDTAVTTLTNRIEEVANGNGGASAVRASFFQDGVWTKPVGYSRHVVVVIGAASGGGRSNGSVSSYGIGGYAGGRNDFEFFDSDLPATVNCVIGLGGLGATADGQPGAAGGQTDFGSYGSAGGALPTAYGFGQTRKALRGGDGGYTFSNAEIAAKAGSGHGFANGGAGGTGTGGMAGGDGNRPSPNTLAEYGTGGGGGARKSGTGNGGRGGNGAVPGGPGGGGGAFATFGFAGNGGNGGDGAIFITSYK
ncbi:hypothetical protein [Rhodococcus sp. 14-2470-1a]|uniref:glycine-rich domain-containing protein n=1 Tax=Rhodococcus sp. 14-2470-1a TaxID=2023150 RepID=UPI000B9AE923|nr:hypothetical protein [Rhodococcus sp. 14-2470-1a]OZF47582.1 hypothetical protein CH292_19365 [Rhodococcus sp. 14-2470-1a]